MRATKCIHVYVCTHACTCIVCMCNKKFIQKYSINVVLAPIVEDIKKLLCIQYLGFNEFIISI